MMSQHINSMLEHLRVGPLKRIKVPNDSSDDSGQQKQQQEQQQQQQQPKSDQPSTAAVVDVVSSTSTMNARGNGAVVSGSSDEIDNSRVSVVINDLRKKSLKEIPNGGVVGIIDAEKKFDPRKRYSISNGDLRVNGKGRELSPAAMKQQQRKLSADMRLRGSNNQLTDDYLLRRPVRLRSICSNFEVYDSLHTKAMDVSIAHLTLNFQFCKYFFLPSFFVFVLHLHFFLPIEIRTHLQKCDEKAVHQNQSANKLFD